MEEEEILSSFRTLFSASTVARRRARSSDSVDRTLIVFSNFVTYLRGKNNMN